MSDKRGAGGNIASGERLVRKAGRVKFDGFWFQNDALLPLVGESVEVQAEDAFFSAQIPVFYFHKFICYARNDYRRKDYSDSN